MNILDTVEDIIHHKNGIIFQINQIEECLLILKSISDDMEKLNSSKFSNYFAFTEKLLIEKILLSLSKIYDQYDSKKENKVRSIKQLIKLLNNAPNINFYFFSNGRYNKNFLKNLSLDKIKSNQALVNLIKKENPLGKKKIRNKITELRNKYLAHNEQHYKISDDKNLSWGEFYELLYFAQDCIHTISSLCLNKSCYINDEFIKLYSIERTGYCFNNIKELIKKE
ncbi:MAG: hypothetical protein WA916_12940 [Arcobacter sp.]|uniref:AbiU2 domain-containing protein n=1 Tax=Arcobacter sp. TaxID=1872629 RepID=UPI003C74AFC0